MLVARRLSSTSTINPDELNSSTLILILGKGQNETKIVFGVFNHASKFKINTLKAHSVVACYWRILHLGFRLRNQPNPGSALSHRQETLTGCQVRDFNVSLCSIRFKFALFFILSHHIVCRAIWFNVLGIGSLLLLCGYGGMVLSSHLITLELCNISIFGTFMFFLLSKFKNRVNG